MYKKTNIFISLILSAFFTIMLIATVSASNSTTHRVSFYQDDYAAMVKEISSGSAFAYTVYPSGTLGSVPNGYKFDGWYTDEAYTNKFDFNTPIYSDLRLFGRLVPISTTHRVSFYQDDYAAMVKEISSGSAFAYTVYPSGTLGSVPNGYKFDGWYTDEAYTNKFDFNTPIYSDLRLFGRLVKL